MNRILHPLDVSIQPPRQFTYPFCYEPHPLCVAAAKQVQQYIEESGVWKGEQSPGKMFGVLVVRGSDKGEVESEGSNCHDGQLGFLAAYSGLLAGRNDWDYFVPPVFDAQQPDGHFKVREREISDINKEINALVASDDYKTHLALYENTKQTVEIGLEQMRLKVVEAKARRDARRREAEQGGEPLTAEEKAAMVGESQFLKAEQRRLRQQCDAMLASMRQPIKEHEERIAVLRNRRRNMSDELQKWLFGCYRMLNALGEERDLIDIFSDTIHAMPPGGSGDCCAPKLLQYAYKHGLEPVCMAEFWWGESPKQEIRHHLHYYPACRSKCLPILTHMLRGLDVEPNPLAQSKMTEKPSVVFEDEYIMVVNKPAGMLSVPGKKESAEECSANNNNLSVEEYFVYNSQFNIEQFQIGKADNSKLKTQNSKFLKSDNSQFNIEKFQIGKADNSKLKTQNPKFLKSDNSQFNIEKFKIGKADNSKLKTQNSKFLKPVHRLDMDTSGLLVLAKSESVYVALQHQFASREVKKRYEAILDGRPATSEGRISLPLIADIMDRPRQRVDLENGKQAITDFRVEQLLPEGRTLIYLYPLTGRTHQLRVHCAHQMGLACPILGDPLYGHGNRKTRMYLHAAMVEFRHPVTGERMRIEASSEWGNKY